MEKGTMVKLNVTRQAMYQGANTAKTTNKVLEVRVVCADGGLVLGSGFDRFRLDGEILTKSKWAGGRSARWIVNSIEVL